MKQNKILFNTLTHPNKILYPEAGITKQQLVDYYISVQDYILPYLVNRLVSLVRCPTNAEEKCFYQKHSVGSRQPGIQTIEIKEKSTEINQYMYVSSLEGLLSLVQMDVLEIHTWGSTIQSLEKPDILVFDLDPAPDVLWSKVVAAAHDVKAHLQILSLESFLKTTGGKGLHVVVPVANRYSWEEISVFTKDFVQRLVKKRPNDYTDTITKSKRSGKIFIDYLRNTRGATAITPYSTRVKNNAAIATPLAWDELDNNISSTTFNVKNFHERLAQLTSDPWQDFFKLKQKLPH